MPATPGSRESVYVRNAKITSTVRPSGAEIAIMPKSMDLLGKINFKGEIDGSPALSNNFMNSIRNNLKVSTEYRAGLTRSARAWHTPAVSSCVNIVLIPQNHQTMTVHLWPAQTNMPEKGIEVFRSHDVRHGDGNTTATVVVPVGYKYMIWDNTGQVAYEFPLRI